MAGLGVLCRARRVVVVGPPGCPVGSAAMPAHRAGCVDLARAHAPLLASSTAMPALSITCLTSRPSTDTTVLATTMVAVRSTLLAAPLQCAFASRRQQPDQDRKKFKPPSKYNMRPGRGGNVRKGRMWWGYKRPKPPVEPTPELTAAQRERDLLQRLECMEEASRLSARIARGGDYSRREAMRAIEAGDVEVDGEVVKNNILTSPSQVVNVKGVTVFTERPRLFLYHKPAGQIVTDATVRGDGRRDKNVNSVSSYLEEHFSSWKLPRIKPVGRLDVKTQGLLLLTNSGVLSRFLELPANGFERHYAVLGTANNRKVIQRCLYALSIGYNLKGTFYEPIRGRIMKSPLEVFDRLSFNALRPPPDPDAEPIEDDDPLRLLEGTGRKRRELKKKESRLGWWLHLALKEGQNREIRRLLQHFDISVARLLRVAYGPFSLNTTKDGRGILWEQVIAGSDQSELAPADIQLDRLLMQKVSLLPWESAEPDSLLPDQVDFTHDDFLTEDQKNVSLPLLEPGALIEVDVPLVLLERAVALAEDEKAERLEKVLEQAQRDDAEMDKQAMVA